MSGKKQVPIRNEKKRERIPFFQRKKQKKRCEILLQLYSYEHFIAILTYFFIANRINGF